MKICTICNLERTLNLFGKKSKSPDGLSPWCKECKKLKDKEHYSLKKIEILKKANNYYQTNKSKVLTKRSLKKESINEYNKKWKQESKEHISEYNLKYRIEHLSEIKEQRKQYRKINKNKINQYSKNKLKTDPLFKLSKRLRGRLRDFLQNNGKKFGKRKIEKYLGCTLEELKNHLEKQFTETMSWDNYGPVWHIDHYIPLKSAKTEDQMYQLCHWTNLKPLEASLNYQKNGSLPKNICWQKLQRDRLLAEDIKLGMPTNLKARDFILSWEKITNEHRKFIERYEWLGTCGFGVRYVFTARYNGLLGGVIMMAEPNGYQFDQKLEILIQRGACASWTPINLGSRLIMFSCNWMIKNTNKRIFTAYSDPEANEIGTIYQACNFDYLGQKFGSEFQFILPDGKLVGTRHFTRTSAMKRWAKELNIKWDSLWSTEKGFQKRSAIPVDIKKRLDEYAKKQYESLPKIKKQLKGKYVLLLTKKGEDFKKTWVKLPYPKRKQE